MTRRELLTGIVTGSAKGTLHCLVGAPVMKELAARTSYGARK
jgi:hypothetical protein